MPAFFRKKSGTSNHGTEEYKQAIMNSFYFVEKPTPSQIRFLNECIQNHPLHIDTEFKAHSKQKEAINLKKELSHFVGVAYDSISDNELVTQGIAKFYQSHAQNIKNPALVWAKIALQNCVDEVLVKEMHKGMKLKA